MVTVMTDKEILDGIKDFYENKYGAIPGKYVINEEIAPDVELRNLIRHLAVAEEGLDMVRLILKRVGVLDPKIELLIVDAYGDNW